MIMTSFWSLESSYDNHLGIVINRAKFNARKSSSFKGVKKYVQTHACTYELTELCFVYINELLDSCAFKPHVTVKT